MFANFIYFILALLIYSTYQPSDGASLTPVRALLSAAALMAVYSIVTQFLFRQVAALAAKGDHRLADHRFTAITVRQSILALVVFAILVHGLGIPSLFHGVRIFSIIPTLLALLFMGVFVGLLTIVWSHAWEAHRRLYDPEGTRAEYVASNLRFSLPVLLPWVLISGLSDLLFTLPMEWPKRFLASAEGQVVYFLSFLLMASVFAPVLVQRFWGCRPLESGYYRKRIEELCRRAGIRYRNILYWPIFGGRMITAGVMGLARRFRYILVTESLLRQLTPDEVDTVIAHEIGHVKKYHLVYYMFFIAGFMIVMSIVKVLFDWTPAFVISYVPSLAPVVDFFFLQIGPGITFGIVAIFTLVFYFRFLFGYFMRNFERQADAYVYTLFDTAAPMISTFEKIAINSGQSAEKPNWHHFSIRERIDFLLRCEKDRRWINRHNRTVKKSLVVYFIFMAITTFAGFQLGFGESDYAIREHLYEKALKQALGADFTKAHLYLYLGDVLYGENNLEKAMEAYERALEIEPDNARALNNLAWLLATAEVEGLQDPKRALDLALKSVALDPSPHALDTLAESYFINHNVESAVETSAMALEQATENHDYYVEQLERFRKTLGKGKRAI